VAEVLNTLDGVNICNEPIYGMRGHGITRWLAARHSTFYDGPGSYRGDYMQPTPSPNMQDNMPKLFADLAAHSWGHNGIKEVYCCHKIPLALEGFRAATEVFSKAPPKIIHLWRSFPGVAASFEKHDYYWWVVQTFESQREGSKGTPVEPIYHLLEPKDDLETLFLIWLAATYRDQQNALAADGISVCYDDLMLPALSSWVRLIGTLGTHGLDLEGEHFGTPEQARILADGRAFVARHGDKLDSLTSAADAFFNIIGEPIHPHRLWEGCRT
jgi:hypothetical protein